MCIVLHMMMQLTICIPLFNISDLPMIIGESQFNLQEQVRFSERFSRNA